MITEIEQLTQDIDWFFTEGNYIGFVASGGGKLPESISLSDDNEKIAQYFRSLPQNSNFSVNPDLKKIISGRKIDDRYLSDFIYMARIGLYSFDKTILNAFSNDEYHLVAKPEIPLKLSELPFEIADQIRKTTIANVTGEQLRVSSVS